MSRPMIAPSLRNPDPQVDPLLRSLGGDRGGFSLAGLLDGAHQLEFGDGSERPADEALNFLRAATDLAGRRLTRRARVGRAREHAVFGRDPAFASVAPERGHAILDARCADDVCAARGDEHGPLGVAEVLRRDHDRAELIGLSGINAHGVDLNSWL